nr:tRNA lysidine(34) synthetase TilS [Lachnospiraceae bacterium]
MISGTRSALAERIRRKGLFRKGGLYLIALSGGCDSVSLLFLMKELAEAEGFALHALHVNHVLREDAAADEAFCVELCGRLSIPLHVFREDVTGFSARNKISLEEAGRNCRYARLRETAGLIGADAVLTAHQRDDQAETVLLALLRGSGLSGLCGMEKRKPFAGSTELIRPLLDISREELEKYLREKGETWREDDSNADETYSRNYVRRTLLPLMEERFPGAAEHVSAAAEHLREAEEYLRHQADAWLSENAQGDVLLQEPLARLDPALRYYVWRQFLAGTGLRDLTEVHFDALKELPEKTSGTRAVLPRGRTVVREQDGLRLVAGTFLTDPEPVPRLEIRTFPRPAALKIPDTPYTKWMDCAIITPDICLRHRQRGDYLILANGKQKKLARFLVDEKIPLGERDSLWLLADGPHILWVVGHRLSYAARITESTETVAEVKISL